MKKRITAVFLVFVFILTGCEKPDAEEIFTDNDDDISAASPVDRIMPSGITQEQMNQDVINQFKKILQDFIIEPGTDNSNDPGKFRMVLKHEAGGGAGAGQVTCSESMGYGMLMLVYAAAMTDDKNDSFTGNADVKQNLKMLGDTQLTLKHYFDGMFRSLMNWPTRMGTQISGRRYLMAWELLENTAGGSWRDSGSSASNATDGDMDMAYALLLADKQWGSDGDYDYRDYALKMIQSLWNDNVDRSNNSYHLKVGNWAGTGAAGNSQISRPSDFMLGHLRTFKAADTANDWQLVIDATNNIIGQITNQQNPRTGLLPGFVFINRSSKVWLANADADNGSLWNESKSSDHLYDWNACRVPWRLTTDILLYGDTVISFGASVKRETTLGTTCVKPLYETLLKGGTNFNGVRGGVAMNGTGGHSWTGSTAYASPAAAAASVYGTPAAMASGWNYMKGQSRAGDYYGDYINVLCMITASGNWHAPEK